MRITGEYLAKAAAFEALTQTEGDPVLKTHYGALAEHYRRLARERQWMLAKEAIKPAPSPLSSRLREREI
jgi:hypothetical protein